MKKIDYIDRYRWNYIDKNLNFIPQYKFVKIKRKCEYTKGLINIIYKLYYKHLRVKYMTDIPSSVKIGPGFYIGHLGGIVINKDVVIGSNVNILNGVLLGYCPRGKHKGAPVIGNRVWIGTNATVIGNIKIGNNVLIAPNAYVNFDVPDNSIVLGNPGKIIQDDNATDKYCECIYNEK